MMGLYNFQPRFVPFILSGRKTHTIRATRANPDKPGNTMHLYTGLRTKKAQLLMRAECVAVESISIRQTWPSAFRNPDGKSHIAIEIDGVRITADEIQALAQREGFAHLGAMLEFWRERLPFEGQIIHWKAISNER